MSSTNDIEESKAKESYSLIGQTTILILSGYLIGAGSHQSPSNSSFYMILAGLTGGVGFVLFKFLYRWRDQIVLQRKCAATTAKLDNLMDRHVKPQSIHNRETTAIGS